MRKRTPRKNTSVGGTRKTKTKKKSYTFDAISLLLANGLPNPETEIMFAKNGLGHTGIEGDGRRWRLDLGYSKEKIGIELQGMTSDPRPCPTCKNVRPGRHRSIKGYREDRVKMNEAIALGWIVIEVCVPEHLNEANMVSWVKRAFAMRAEQEEKK